VTTRATTAAPVESVASVIVKKLKQVMCVILILYSSHWLTCRKDKLLMDFERKTFP
jgi:hypothetical protein